MLGRRQLAIAAAEFIGTGVLSLVLLNVQHTSIGFPYFVALAAGLSLATMGVAVMQTGDGAHFNPAITIGMWVVRQIKTVPALVYIVAQMLGAWAAYFLYKYMTQITIRPIGGQFDPRVFWAEAVGAFILAFAYAAAVFNRFLNAKMAAVIGAAFTLAIIVASSASIGLVNPAIALSVRAFAVIGSMGWLNYALAPILGSVLGFLIYDLLFAPQSSFDRMRTMVTSRMNSRPAVATAKMRESRATTEEAPAKTASSSSRRSSSSRTASSRSRSRSSRSRR